MIEPVRSASRSATWTRSGTPEDALSVIEAYTRSHNGRIKKSSNQLTLYFGSRLVYRLMGIWTTRIPYTVRVSAAASQGTATKLTAEAYSDEDPYIYHLGPFIYRRPEGIARTFEAHLSETLNELQQQ
jgi:hypothetical protein